MNPRQTEMVADALETVPELLPWIPELLADLDELGCDAEQIVRILDGYQLPTQTHVVDLACGKGAVAVEIADELAFTVTGIELFEPFLPAARELAAKAGVTDRCTFVAGDVTELAGALPPADVAVFAAVGDAIGSHRESVEIIRKYVRSGGLIVIQDGYLAEGAPRHPAFSGYGGRKEMIEQITAAGDALIGEFAGEEDSDEEADAGSDTIETRAQALAQMHPEMADQFLKFAADQAAEERWLDDWFVDSTWVLRRS